MTQAQPAIQVDQVAFSWDLEKGLMLIWGQPVLCWWIETTMAGFMAGLHRMVGTERFNLALEGAGRESIEGEWNNIIKPMPTVEEGLAFIGQCMRTVGLGETELLELDREGRRLRFRARNSWEGIYQRAMGVNWGAWSLAGKLVAYGERILDCPCGIEQTAFIAKGDEFDEFTIMPSATTYAQRLGEVVDTDNATRQDLADALVALREEVRERQAIESRLRDEIAERERVEADLRAKIDLVDRQEQALREVTTPILQVWPGIVALPIIGAIDGERAASIMEALLSRITAVRARLVIIDLTGAATLDADAADRLISLISATRLLGARGVMSGISPEMASTLAATDARLHDIRTYSTLEAALRDGVRT